MISHRYLVWSVSWRGSLGEHPNPRDLSRRGWLRRTLTPEDLSRVRRQEEEIRYKAASDSGSPNHSGFAYSCSRLSLFVSTTFDTTVSLLHTEPQFGQCIPWLG